MQLSSNLQPFSLQTNTQPLRLNTNNKRHFLIYMLTALSISTFVSFNYSMFTEEAGNTIINKDRREF